MKKLFFTIFVVLFFSLLFAVESIAKLLMKLFGYFPRAAKIFGPFENAKGETSYQHV